jgi:hypothetical protein
MVLGEYLCLVALWEEIASGSGSLVSGSRPLGGMQEEHGSREMSTAKGEGGICIGYSSTGGGAILLN